MDLLYEDLTIYVVARGFSFPGSFVEQQVHSAMESSEDTTCHNTHDGEATYKNVIIRLGIIEHLNESTIHSTSVELVHASLGKVDEFPKALRIAEIMATSVNDIDFGHYSSPKVKFISSSEGASTTCTKIGKRGTPFPGVMFW